MATRWTYYITENNVKIQECNKWLYDCMVMLLYGCMVMMLCGYMTTWLYDYRSFGVSANLFICMTTSETTLNTFDSTDSELYITNYKILWQERRLWPVEKKI